MPKYSTSECLCSSVQTYNQKPSLEAPKSCKLIRESVPPKASDDEPSIFPHTWPLRRLKVCDLVKYFWQFGQIRLAIWTNIFGSLYKYCLMQNNTIHSKSICCLWDGPKFALIAKSCRFCQKKSASLLLQHCSAKFYFDLFVKEFSCQLILESLLEHRAKLSKISDGCCSNYKLVI